ncbi:hypothetical protein NW762_007474 [Fusarium torreyae]|uniref:Xylanolytic transcriptional activator regulatory domain-containing protein n=1 Tax=Fusarium torreyae TaxID=1237075 RepID=A0A9W8RZN1_9HYPO|nr:hypothetical protein NW762_007474 [Fusarium torreyae]
MQLADSAPLEIELTSSRRPVPRSDDLLISIINFLQQRNMDSIAAIRRRRRRRVTDENRKRAPRADKPSPRECESPMPHENAPAAPAPPSQSTTTPQDNITIDSHQTESILWPRFLTKLREAFSLDPISGPEEQEMVSLQANITRRTNPSPSEQSRLKRVIDAFPPRSVADFLVSVCIRHGVDIFFYFDQAQVIKEIDQFYTNQLSPLRLDPSFVCLLLTIFALGSQWTPLERPDNSPSHRVEESDPGRVFYEQAKFLMPDIIERPCLRSIQACFILGVYLMPSNAVGSSYIYMGIALRKALAFDLHQDPDDHTLDVREREIRRRLWWSIYSLERCTTIKLNRPRSVQPHIITAPLPTPLPDLDDRQKFNNVLLQIAYARLISILDRVADWESSATVSTDRIESTAVENELTKWKNSLPAEFDLENIHPQDSLYRAVFHLYLNYYYAWIVMGKMSLITVVRMTLRHHLGEDPQPPVIDETVEKLSKSCTKASKKLLQLFEDLGLTGNTNRFSFTDFQGCSIATIVTLIAGILERDPGYQSRVNFGLRCLRTMAAGNLTAKVGVRFVEALQSISNEASRKLSQSRSFADRPQQGEVSLTSSAYNDWAEWLASQEQPHLNHRDGAAEGETAAEITIPGRAPPSSEAELWPGLGSEQEIGWSPRAETVLEPLTMTRPLMQQQSMAGPHLGPPDNYLFPAGYNDDQAFLMGLTGLDVLDFAGYPTELG